MNRAKLCIRFSANLHRRHLRSLPSLRHNFHLLPNSPAQPSVFSQSPPGFRVSEPFPRSKLFSSHPCANGDAVCWSCGSPVLSRPALVCESCGVIQPVDRSVDYFQIFGLIKQYNWSMRSRGSFGWDLGMETERSRKKTYDIEEGSLNGKFKDWQKKLHPDLVHSKPEREREYAAEQSARVIDACRTLNNPLRRAIYLMKLQGIVVDEEQTILEPDLLAEIMEIREAVEETADPQTLRQMQSQVSEKMEHWSNHFSSAFQNQDTEEALKSIRRMRYYQRVNEEIEKKL